MSIGIAGAFGAAVDRQRLLVNADLALYRAKSLGRNRFEFYTACASGRDRRAKRWATASSAGSSAENSFPISSRRSTRAPTRSSASRRWRAGVIRPSACCPRATSSPSPRSSGHRRDRPGGARGRARQSSPLERAKACGRRDCRSTSRCAGCTRRVCRRAERPRVAPGELSFELVESIYLDERDDRFFFNVEQIKALGIDIEIDDFGSGYASIVSLTKIKPRRLKIDRQLVTPIVRSAAQRRLVRSIVEIGRSLDIEVAAEGVETMEHAALLRDLGCVILQGYAFARPMPADELAALSARAPAADRLGRAGASPPNEKSRPEAGPFSPRARSCGSSRELPKHVRQDAAGAEILEFVERIDTADQRRARGSSRPAERSAPAAAGAARARKRCRGSSPSRRP